MVWLAMQVMGIASDRALNMGRLMEKLEDYRIGPDNWICCWAHILNTLGMVS